MKKQTHPSSGMNLAGATAPSSGNGWAITSGKWLEARHVLLTKETIGALIGALKDIERTL